MSETARRRALMMGGQGGGYEHGTWEDLFYHIDKGDYATAYAVGEVFPLDLGEQGTVNMEIVALSKDDKTEGGKAPVSLIAVELLTTSKRYNPTSDGATEGTGNIGGWEKSELRNYLNTTIYDLIPQIVKDRIVPVKKYTQGHIDASTADRAMLSTETIWSPSIREIAATNNNSAQETAGVIYYPVTSTTTYRTKHKWNSTTAIQWWTRTGDRNTLTSACAPTNAGSISGGFVKVVTNSYGVCIGFCVG